MALSLETTPSSSKMGEVATALAASLLSVEGISAIASAVTTGASVAGTVASMVQTVNRSVVCGIELSNSTKYFLEFEGYFASWGHVKTPSFSVSPGKKEAMIAYKSKYSTTGTTGVAVWKVGDTDTRVIIMWSIPWNHNHHNNVLAVGFKEGKIILENKHYREMYYEKESWFRRQEYTKDIMCQSVEMSHKNMTFKVQGTMGTGDKCEVKVEFLPLTKDTVAEGLRRIVFNLPD